MSPPFAPSVQATPSLPRLLLLLLLPRLVVVVVPLLLLLPLPPRKRVTTAVACKRIQSDTACSR